MINSCRIFICPENFYSTTAMIETCIATKQVFLKNPKTTTVTRKRIEIRDPNNKYLIAMDPYPVILRVPMP